MTDKGGYVMLMNVLIMCAALVAVAVAASLALSRGLGSGVVRERGTSAQRLAEGCAEAALYELQQDEAYAGNETVAILGQTCLIRPIVPGTPLIVQVEASGEDGTYRLEIEVDDPERVDVGAWKRVTAF